MTAERTIPKPNGQDADAIEGMPGDVDVSILIVGYKCMDLTMDCLASLFEHTHGLNFEVLYTDCSNDGSLAAVRERYPQVRVVDNTENLGFGRGNNFLAKHSQAKYLLLLNPDTVIKDNAIGELYEFAQRNLDAGAWGGITELPDGRIDPGCRQPGPSLRNPLLLLLGMSKHFDGGLPEEATEGGPVPTLTGAFMMVKRSVWEDLGGFDESFFMYCEELDLCYRIRKAGHGIMMTPKARILHLVGSGSGQSASRMIALTKGAIHFNRKHFGSLYIAVDIALRWVYSVSRYALGVIGLPLVGKQRAKELRQRHLPIITRPGEWTRGWS